MTCFSSKLILKLDSLQPQVISLGLGAASALAAAVQNGQISTLQRKVDEKADATNLNSVTSRVAALESAVTTLSGASSSSSTALASICTAVCRRSYYYFSSQ